MMLADAINLPLVGIFGLATFGPLTLLVTTIESATFRGLFGVPIRQVFRTLLWANIWSTLAGLLVLIPQDLIVSSFGIMDTIPDFVRGYRRVALLLVLLYWSKSVLVESMIVLARNLPARLEQPSGKVLRGVVLANVLSYLVVGPLFYLSTRPYFGGLEATDTTEWSANGAEWAYYIDPDTGFIERIRLDGGEKATVVPFPAKAFLMSGDEQTFVFDGEGDTLYLFRAGSGEPTPITKHTGEFFMIDASLAPDGRRVAYLSGGSGTFRTSERTLNIWDSSTGERSTVPGVVVNGRITWSADGGQIYAKKDAWTIVAIDCASSFSLREIRISGPPTPQEVQSRKRRPASETGASAAPSPEVLVDNYLRGNGVRRWGGPASTDVWWMSDQAEGLAVNTHPYLGTRVEIEPEGSRRFIVQCAYGLLNLGGPRWEYPAVLPSGSEIIVEGWYDQLYIIDVANRRIGLLFDGRQYVVRTPRFRLHFE